MCRVIIIICCIIPILGFSQKQKVWLDADTGNEMDDLYAIARLVKAPTIDLVGISSAHFNNADLVVFEKWNAYDAKNLITVNESQRLNEEILQALNRLDVPHPLGADRQIGRAWGWENPRDSPAAQAIIAVARNLPAGQKLDIITLGPLTNIATAVMLAPDILSEIRCYSLGAKYNVEKKIWNKNEFNIRNDLNAFDYLLNLEGFDFIVMPIDVAFPLQFEREKTYQQLNNSVPIEKILADRWREHNPQDKTRIMWDLAIVEAYLNPSFTKIIKVNTPLENKKRKIHIFSKIDEKACAQDFWENLKQSK
ncbi:MAG: nucleoside hydrolase [Saprospiraceae bacterium]